jgi:hypothetical protein
VKFAACRIILHCRSDFWSPQCVNGNQDRAGQERVLYAGNVYKYHAAYKPALDQAQLR